MSVFKPSTQIGRRVGSLSSFAGLLCLGLTALGLWSCSKQELRVGYIASFNGVMSELGVSGRNGARLALEQINQEGGLLGRPLALELIEDNTDGATAFEATLKAKDSGIRHFIGPLTSGAAKGLTEVIKDPEIIFLSPSVTMASVYKADDSLFLFLPAAAVQGQALAKAALKSGKSACVVLETGNAAYTEDVLRGFSEEFSANGGQIQSVHRYKSSVSVSLDTAAITDIASHKADLILSLGPAPETAALVQKLHKITPGIPVFASTWSMTKDLPELAGAPGQTITVAGFVDMESDNPDFVSFRERYKALFGAEPSFSSILSYESVMAFASAVRAAKSLEPKALKAKLVNAKAPGLQGPIALDRYGDPERDIMMFRIKNGDFERIRW